MKYKKTIISSAIASASIGALVGVWAFASHILKTRYPAEYVDSDSMDQNDTEALLNHNHKSDRKDKVKELKRQIKNLKRNYKDSIDVNETLVKSLSKKDSLLDQKEYQLNRLINESNRNK